MVINTRNCINNHTSNNTNNSLTIIIILTSIVLGNKYQYITYVDKEIYVFQD